jgi:hypothetical protein
VYLEDDTIRICLSQQNWQKFSFASIRYPEYTPKKASPRKEDRIVIDGHQLAIGDMDEERVSGEKNGGLKWN